MDPIQIVDAIAKYTSRFGLSTRIPHLEGEEYLDQRNAKQTFHLG
jgi:hypothetical protein